MTPPACTLGGIKQGPFPGASAVCASVVPWCSSLANAPRTGQVPTQAAGSCPEVARKLPGSWPEAAWLVEACRRLAEARRRLIEGSSKLVKGRMVLPQPNMRSASPGLTGS